MKKVRARAMHETERLVDELDSRALLCSTWHSHSVAHLQADIAVPDVFLLLHLERIMTPLVLVQNSVDIGNVTQMVRMRCVCATWPSSSSQPRRLSLEGAPAVAARCTNTRRLRWRRGPCRNSSLREPHRPSVNWTRNSIVSRFSTSPR